MKAQVKTRAATYLVIKFAIPFAERTVVNS
jgi:hypothetical protein